ncbi:MAG: peptidoglycan DD-metalloendopeptidase family protein [Rickettsiales bacterium]|jgi:septal ring factor EnvC (AmiA/AmiB activator)|nr:peptidoglycan DD-metalloendopeptidase family protein [Rickettsiales bacterium]
MVRFWIAASLTLLAMTVFVNAAHASSKEELTETKQQIEEAKKKQQALKHEREELETELTQLQRQLVSAVAELQRRETALSAAEDKLALIQAKQKSKEQELAGEREKLAVMIEAALRLSRTPPEAMVLMPDDSEKTMLAARALKMTTSGIKGQSELIRLQLSELQVLSSKLKAQSDALSKDKERFATEQKSLELKLSERRSLQQKLSDDEQKQADAIAKLAKQAENLQDLVGRIESARRTRGGRPDNLETSDGPVRGTRGKLRSFSKAKGEIRPPASGKVIQYFGAASGRNETSRGMVLLTRAEARVSAPFDGEVVYAGSFMGYGRMVILRHSDDFHTLLSGLADIDTKAGEFLLEGEPIGAMGDDASSTRLYLELRKNNQPIDPASWIKN